MTKPLHDYFYRFPQRQPNIPGRCRVRIYRRKNGTHTVLLTELDTNEGESITSACDRIATHLVATRGLNPKTTRWIQQDFSEDVNPQGEISEVFDELVFTWDGNQKASDPQWQRLTSEQVEALTGADMSTLSRRLGDFELQIEEKSNHESTETQRST